MVKQTNSKLPKHVAIIMDGNGRWATNKDLSRQEGHLAGVQAARKIIKHSAKKGIDTLSLFTLSNENLNRPSEEVQYLMEIYMDVIKSDSESLKKEGLKVKFIGDHSVFSEQLQTAMLDLEKTTASNSRMNLLIAMNYSGKWDICNSIIKISEQIQAKKLDISSLNMNSIDDFLSTKNYSEPDLLIRTSGEYRISNFYLWQLAYTELYFTDIYWPDFDEQKFDEAIDDFSKRFRRFGLRDE